MGGALIVMALTHGLWMWVVGALVIIIAVAAVVAEEVRAYLITGIACLGALFAVVKLVVWMASA
jgi:hypothetical protein